MACTSDGSADLLYSRIEDIVYLSDKRCAPCFLGFLDLREQALVRRRLISQGVTNWRLFGGYEDAERAVLAVFPDYYDPQSIEYPFSALAFRYRSVHKLSHRDFLGTLLATGIRRDKIGDILCGEGLTVVFLRDEIVPYVCKQIDRIGGEGVTIIPDYTGELPLSREYEEIRETIASPRLDVIVKTLTRSAREDAAQLIRIGSVSVDHLPVESVSMQLTAPCKVSVRGSGRFLIDQIGPETKKGRLLFFARKCI